MKTQLTQKKLFIKPSAIHGYGVFAAEAIQPGDVIEECYSILTQGEDVPLNNFYFAAAGKSAVLTGFGFVYNHADIPNAKYSFDELRQLMVFTAKREIAKDEEIFISYGDGWFDNRSMPVKKMTSLRQFWRFFCGVPLRGFLVYGGLMALIAGIQYLSL